MVFTVLGAVAELERDLIVERVKAGLRNAKAKGKQLRRPKIGVDPARIAALRRASRSWGVNRERDGLDERDGPERHLRPAALSWLAQNRLAWFWAGGSGQADKTVGRVIPGSA
jgi:DNA invertase Pin-like site-specific DNA recombinase